ncbi:MAG: adenylosuccinate lyase [Candidatus Delongbacteria bacterium]|nr:adenylosuccinate lyase [Candidatus Delongbacteria bacterium]MCG2760539.1 adenylosuccinate lyase [Candidatus Delongbacteria bacterium]
MEDRTIYSNPLIERYSSKEMSYIFSPENKFRTWRKLWITLAECEKELGLNITQEQIDELKKFETDINYEEAEKKEKIVRHDVMSHVYAYGLQCPNAKGIIHLGATSAFVGDNTDLIQMKQGLNELRRKLVALIKKMKDFAIKEKDRPTLGFTHFQAAQLTTVGKRTCLWMNEFVLDLEEINFCLSTLKFRGVKGSTGTQASYMKLFDDDADKVKTLDEMVTERMGFDKKFIITGQTYTRKVDSRIMSSLSALAQSAHKTTNDIRLLQNLKEIEEPFEKNQVGSSAMAYKRNPMRSERVSSLSKYVISLSASTAMISSTQWFERTLDDSANKRLAVPEAFLATDAILIILNNIFDGLVVYPKQIEKRIISEIPFMATENIIMNAVKKGGDRQELHERIRELSMTAGKNVKELGLENNLLELIAADETFNLTANELNNMTDPKLYIGRAPGQVIEFIKEVVDPIIEKYYLGDISLELKI